MLESTWEWSYCPSPSRHSLSPAAGLQRSSSQNSHQEMTQEKKQEWEQGTQIHSPILSCVGSCPNQGCRKDRQKGPQWSGEGGLALVVAGDQPHLLSLDEFKGSQQLSGWLTTPQQWEPGQPGCPLQTRLTDAAAYKLISTLDEAWRRGSQGSPSCLLGTTKLLPWTSGP